jgi:thiosulfate/3-mercaptopyruvate sulfurtransferase
MTRTSDLIDIAELTRIIDSPACRVVDCRFDLFDKEKGYADYLAAHLPGAVYAHMDRDLAGPVTPESGRHPLPDPAEFRATLAAWGIGNDTHVVAYDDHNGAVAARLWWMLRYWMGHSQVSVLDGGIAAWVAAGGAVESEELVPVPAVFDGQPDDDVVATTEEIAADVAAGSDRLLLDARDPVRFRGDKEPIDTVAGHIPGAVNLPLGRSLGEGGRWRDDRALSALWSEFGGGAASGRPVAMCGSGVTACHLILSATLAGAPVPRLYVGSWSEWIRDPDRPIGLGADADSG